MQKLLILLAVVSIGWCTLISDITNNENEFEVKNEGSVAQEQAGEESTKKELNEEMNQEVRKVPVLQSAKGRSWSNIALHRPVTQSSTWNNGQPIGGYATNAVDGNTNPDYDGRSCSHTEEETEAWWAVDLGEPTKVAYIKVSTRNRAWGVLENFNVGLTNIDPTAVVPHAGRYPVCAHVQSRLPLARTTTITCRPGLSGRYLIIQLLASISPITLCEVEVYPHPRSVGQ